MPYSGQGVFGASWPPDRKTTSCTIGAVQPLAQAVTLAMLAIGFWFLVHLLIVAHFHILKLVHDALEKQWLALALVIFCF